MKTQKVPARDELEVKAADVLKDLTESITDTPQSLLGLYVILQQQFKNDPQALQKLDELARTFVSRVPDLARIVSDSAKVLETYLSYRTSQRQEEATESLLRQNKVLSYATVFLALSTFSLVIVTVLLHF